MNELLMTFAVVVEHGSLNKASRSLNITQPALSRKIAKLEEELGVELFLRKGKRLELTRIGQICYEFAVRMRDLRQSMLSALNDYKEMGVSSILIGASLTTLQSTLPEIITVFNRESPATDIKAVTGKTHEIVALVKEKKVDIGLVASYIDNPELTCIPLFDDHLCLVAPEHQWVKEDGAGLGIGDLNGMPMILFSKGTWYRVLTDELFNRYRVYPDVKMEIDSFEAILRLVSTCKVATLLPKSYLRQTLLDENGLTSIPILELEQTTRTTSLLYSDSSMLKGSVKLLIAKAESHFRSK